MANAVANPHFLVVQCGGSSGEECQDNELLAKYYGTLGVGMVGVSCNALGRTY